MRVQRGGRPHTPLRRARVATLPNTAPLQPRQADSMISRQPERSYTSSLPASGPNTSSNENDTYSDPTSAGSALVAPGPAAAPGPVRSDAGGRSARGEPMPPSEACAPPPPPPEVLLGDLGAAGMQV
jgi:hypothetical protein